MLNFAYFNSKNTYISTCKNVQIYKITLQMNSNCVYMHDYCSCANDFFILFFSLPIMLLSHQSSSHNKEKKRWVGHVGSGLIDIIKNLRNIII